MSLTSAALEQLELAGLKKDRFQELVTRLFAYGIVVRDEDGVEQRIYDDARRIEGLLTEYFGLAGFYHQRTTAFRIWFPVYLLYFDTCQFAVLAQELE